MTNREKIKIEALKLFAEFGYFQTSVRMIAKNVGIRESAIYNHFPSKKDLFLELVYDGKKRVQATNYINEEMLNMLSTPEQFFQKFVEQVIEVWSKLEERMFTKMMIQAKFNSSVEFELTLNDLFSGISDILEIVFEELRNYGFIKDYNNEFLSEQFIAPLVVLKFRFLINNFYDKRQVLDYALRHASFFWEQIKL